MFFLGALDGGCREFFGVTVDVGSWLRISNFPSSSKTGKTVNTHINQKRLQAELALLRARYNSGAVSPAVYAAIKKLETEVAWLNYNITKENESAAA